jgi:hypothetical protein
MNLKKFIFFFLFNPLFLTLKGQDTITNRTDTDGFGSQFQNIIATAVFAELNNKKFVYTPFKAMEHNYDNDPDFIQKKEELINFIGNFELNTNEKTHQQYQSKVFFDDNIDRCAKTSILKKIKTIFRLNKKYQDYFSPDYFNVAVHIRRFNEHDNRIEGTSTSDQYFLKTIKKIEHFVHNKKKIIFHIYSQGEIKKFHRFKNIENVVFHLNESIETSFASMVFADALVMSASSFSYAAALISDGIILYHPFWHNPLPHWIFL